MGEKLYRNISVCCGICFGGVADFTVHVYTRNTYAGGKLRKRGQREWML